MPRLTMIGAHTPPILEFGGRYASGVFYFVGNIVGFSVVGLFIF